MHGVREKETGHLKNEINVENSLCNVCNDWLKHKNRAKIARQSYQRDKENQLKEDQLIVSADLEKVW